MTAFYRIRSGFFRSLLAAFLLLTAGPDALAEDAGKTIRVFGSDSSLPKHFAERGQPRGYAYDIALEALRRAGYVGEAEAMPWQRAQQNAIDGQGIVIAFSRTPEREADYLFTRPTFVDTVVLVYRRDDPEFQQGEPEIAGHRVAFNRASRYCPAFNEALKLADSILQTTDVANRLTLLMHDRVDIAVFSGGMATVRAAAEKADIPLGELAIAAKPICADPNHIGIGKSFPNGDLLRQKLDVAIEAMEQDGTIDAMRASYGVEP